MPGGFKRKRGASTNGPSHSTRARKKTRARKRGRGRRYAWESYSDEELLDVRMCDLDLRIEGSWLEDQIERVQWELEMRGLDLRPHFWIGDEWFSPENVPGVAVPFYLAHPRLMRLERNQMLDCEGGTRDECLRLLRHELGHAVQHGFQIQRRRAWQRAFGKSSEPYPEYYRPNPASRKFVQHLDGYYAQCHPDEDFAETFAVWLRPRSDWRRRYEGWPAIKKLQYVDELMKDLAGERPVVKSRAKPYSLPSLRRTLRTHYARKREHYSVGFTDAYDRDLRRLFRADGGRKVGESASAFLRRHRHEIRETVCNWTGEYQFTCDQVLKEMIGRCRELKLRAVGSQRQLKLDFAILLTMHSMRYLHRGREWHPV